MKEAGRNSNMELLRIVSMLMVLSLHYLLFGNVLSRSTVGGAAYYACWTVEAIGHISVDCYMLISGYFLSRKQFTSRRILPNPSCRLTPTPCTSKAFSFSESIVPE